MTLKLGDLVIPTPIQHPIPPAVLLEITQLIKRYGGRPVVNGLSFTVRKGEVVGLLGPNGAGKTTAFYMTIGLIRPDGGRVIFREEDITNYKVHERARLGMGYLAQEPSVFRQLTVEENILSILETLNLSPHERRIKSDQLLTELHLTSLAKKKAGTLSGGERRRVEIARSLTTDPLLLLLDEPFANIDPLAIEGVKRLIQHLKERGISVLITDHNAREISSIVDRSYLLCDGRVLISGTVEELLDEEIARSSYFGRDFRL